MKRWILTPVAIVALAASVHADENGGKLGLGFHGTDAPLGARWRISDHVAIDAGVGFGSTVIADDHAQRVSANLGVLFPLARWNLIRLDEFSPAWQQ